MSNVVSGELLLEVVGLRKSYDDHQVLNDVDLRVNRGEILGLVGENGAGKTTLVSIIAGSLGADEGTMFFEGRDIDPTDRKVGGRPNIGIIEQDSDRDLTLSVEEFLMPRLEAGKKRLKAARQLLIRVGLAIDVSAKMGELSKAERGLLEFARLLADESLTLIIIDELAATFNARETEDLLFIAKQIARAGRTVINVSHRLGKLLEMCDRIAVLRNSRIEEIVNAADTSEEELVQAVHVNEAPAEPAMRDNSVIRDDLGLLVRSMTSKTIQDASFSVRKGEVVALVGRRDSGIDEIVQALTGDQPAQVHTLRVGGRLVTISSPHDAAVAGITFCGEDQETTSVDPFMAAARSMFVGDQTTSDNFDEDVTNLTDALAALAALTQQHHLAMGKPLSGGQQQSRVMMEVLGIESELLILIEPTRGLDTVAKAKLCEQLQAVTAKGRTVLMVSSISEDVISWSDRILVLEDGAVRANWETASITAEQLDEIIVKGFDAAGHEGVSVHLDESREKPRDVERPRVEAGIREPVVVVSQPVLVGATIGGTDSLAQNPEVLVYADSPTDVGVVVTEHAHRWDQ